MFSFKIDENLRLELPDPRHAEEATKIVRENLEHLSRWMPWAVPDYSIETARDWITRTRDEYAKSGSFNAVILYDGKIVGSVGFHDLDQPNRHASIGYWVDKNHEGKGIVTRCCRVLIDYLFGTMELHRVQINCNVENTRSIAVAERLGFTLEGTLRECELLNGRFGDWRVYSMLRSEWKNL